MTGVRGFTALQIILASGFTKVTDLGHLPRSLETRLAVIIPENVTLVRADHSVNFHLASKSADAVRSDTTIYPWIVSTVSIVVCAPDYLLQGGEAETFQLLKRIPPPAKYPSLEFMRLPIKYVPRERAASHEPELWLRTVILHDDASAEPYISNGSRIGA